MHCRHTIRITVLVILVTVAAVPCASDSFRSAAKTEKPRVPVKEHSSKAKAHAVVIKFLASVGQKPFNCGETYDGFGATGSKVKVTDFRFFITNVRLVDAKGKETPVALTNDGKWQSDKVALIAFENGEGVCGAGDTNTEIKGTVANGKYVGLRYSIGVPTPENHADQAAAPSPLNLSEMFWSWNAGYKFIRIEMKTTGKPNGYVLHLGSTNCEPTVGTDPASTECGFLNLPEADFPQFNLNTDLVTVDLEALYEGVNVDVNQEKTAVGCMSSQQDLDCAGVFKNLGLKFGELKPSAQQFLRVEKQTPRVKKQTAKLISQNITAYEWELPKGFPTPRVPADNPMTSAKVALGRHLFYDARLSINSTTSCATCHVQSMAFTDGKARAMGATGEIHPRGSMSLTNVTYSPTLNWANPSVTLLERQPLVPLFGEHPVEMGMAGKEKGLLARIKAEPRYQSLFSAAYPGEADAYTLGNLTKALASFVRTLISGNSPYDRYKYQSDASAISASAKRGEELFFSERLECFDCHTGFNLSGPTDYAGKSIIERTFQNNGLYNLNGTGAYPADNTGIFEITANANDMGKFKVPTLRNVALTAPYMHDGSIKTLEEVVDHYQAGGRTLKTETYTSVGSASPFKSNLVRGFDLNADERQDLIAFLRSLTDTEFVTNSKFSNPWTPTQ